MNRSFISLLIAALTVGAIAILRVPACAEMLHLEIDTSATKISASVMQPLFSLLFGDTATPVVGTFRVDEGVVDGDPANVAKTGSYRYSFEPQAFSGRRQELSNFTSAL